MKNRLALAIGLAVLGLTIGAAIVGAKQSTVLEVGEISVELDLPGQLEAPDLQGKLPACSNLKDDDGDGKSDLADPDCSGPLDNSEAGDAPAPDGDGEGHDNEPGETGGGNTGKTSPTDVTIKPNKSKKQSGTGGSQGPAKKGERKPDKPPPQRTAGGVPTTANPTLTIAQPGPAPIGVPNFIIDRFSIPPFLLPIYQACGTQYSIPWQVLASINRIETAFGTNLNVSSAGAVGWMQFLPSSWKAYGVDANEDGRKDPYNPVDAICAAARYLRAAGGEENLRDAIFAYNHADWYVDEVLLYANQYGKLPADLVSSVVGLTEGARFPVAAPARYADDISEREAARRARPGAKAVGNVADVITDSPTRRGINIYSRKRAPVVAVNDGVIRKIGKNKRLGRHIVLEDAYGNRFTYARLGEVADSYPVPKQRRLSADDFKLVTPKRDAAPESSATGGGEVRVKAAAKPKRSSGPANSEDARERIFALPERPKNVGTADLTGQIDKLLASSFPGYEGFKAYFSGVLRFDSKTMRARTLREGSKVIAGTVLGRIGKVDRQAAPHVHFAIAPAGRGARKIDPKPILDGWKLLEATAIYRASGESPFEGRANVGQILLMSKAQLQRRVLQNPNLEIYSCGRQDIQSGITDRRVMAGMEFLAARGFRLTVTSLTCGHSYLTKSGSVSHHSTGNAVDIARINGVPVLGNQGKGSISEAVVRELLQLQGTMRPAQIITLMDFGESNTFAMGDHADHVHVGWQPPLGAGKAGKRLIRILKPSQWGRLVDRLAEIEQPEVPVKPSKYSLPAKGAKRSSDAHLGE